MIKPLLIARAFVLLPGKKMSTIVGRELSKKSIDLAVASDKLLSVFSQIDPEKNEPTFSGISQIGTLAKIIKFEVDKEGDYLIELEGISRVQPVKWPNSENDKINIYELDVNEFKNQEQFTKVALQELISVLPSFVDESGSLKKEGEQLLKDAHQYLINFKDGESQEICVDDSFSNFVDKIVEFIARVQPDYEWMINVLETPIIEQRINLITKRYLSNNPIQETIQETTTKVERRIQESMQKQQKEYYLRERLRSIKEELGDVTGRDEDTEKYRKRIQKYPYPVNIKERVLEEISKLEGAGNINEVAISRSYIEWLLDLPYWQETKDNFNLNNVVDVLNKNHYGIEKVKERIIEYIALKMQNPKSKSPIVCLVGPPGVGKTSLAKSIAEALHKHYVKVSLGGVRDESEIRGHRKTYLGAMPGRIIKGMKKAKVVNPLYLLDEIDKMGNDANRGDPSSALLEVLDPEQNKSFSDHYIEEEYDLSNVMFVATANYINQIPHALYDRLEIIELSSYTANEKKEIAKNYLIKRVLNEANLKPKAIKFEDEAIDFIINYYTKEAGVRELERVIQTIVRKILVLKLKGEQDIKTVNEKIVSQLLGKKRYDISLKDKKSMPGIVNGMAYTAAGGDLLPIEATFFKGKGNIVITGNLEKTMNESVSVAVGYVKANASAFGIDPDKFIDRDIHIHVPSGGIPKDGPSAGVALTTAIISAFRDECVPTTISMTGEITLRGKVGIIGGVKEKVISAYRAGIREIFIPKDDERFLEEIPKEILSDITVHLVAEYSEVFNSIFNNKKRKLEHVLRLNDLHEQNKKIAN